MRIKAMAIKGSGNAIIRAIPPATSPTITRNDNVCAIKYIYHI